MDMHGVQFHEKYNPTKSQFKVFLLYTMNVRTFFFKNVLNQLK
jgi:hypothetical protein